MIELVTQAYMLMAPVGVLVAVYCAARLLEARDPKWLDGGGGIRGKPLAVPLSSLRFPTAPSGVQRIGGYQPTKTHIERMHECARRGFNRWSMLTMCTTTDPQKAWNCKSQSQSCIAEPPKMSPGEGLSE